MCSLNLEIVLQDGTVSQVKEKTPYGENVESGLTF